MSLIGHLVRIVGQLVSYSWRSHCPGLLLLIVIGGAVVLIGLAVQLALPVAIYPFL